MKTKPWGTTAGYLRQLLIVCWSLAAIISFSDIDSCHAFVPTSLTTKSSSSSNPSCQWNGFRLYSETCDVAVFGGGFGGLYTALSLARQQRTKKLDIVLIDPSTSFVFLPLLYDLTVGTATESEVCPLYSDLLTGTGIRHVQTSVELLHAANKTAILKDGSTLYFDNAVVAVGARPILESVPGAAECAQPFYTSTHAKQTRRLLNKLPVHPRVAIVGGGYGGVELAASVQRRIPRAMVTLLSRGPPLARTRAEPWIHRTLHKLGVEIENCAVLSLQPASSSNHRVVMQRKLSTHQGEEIVQDEWDAVLWTAGSRPADPVASQKCSGLQYSASGRLAVDVTLRCRWEEDLPRLEQPCLWALGDCAEIVDAIDTQAVLPKTAQVAMQQADTVASNVLAQLTTKDMNRVAAFKTFAYQDLGSMLTLGGPNAAVLAPREGAFAPIFAPILETASFALNVADDVLSGPAEKLGLGQEQLGMSLGSHGLGVPNDTTATGTLAGTLGGAARRAVYSVRMPTNQQRAISLISAAISTAASLAKEAAERRQDD